MELGTIRASDGSHVVRYRDRHGVWQRLRYRLRRSGEPGTLGRWMIDDDHADTLDRRGRGYQTIADALDAIGTWIYNDTANECSRLGGAS